MIRLFGYVWATAVVLFVLWLINSFYYPPVH